MKLTPLVITLQIAAACLIYLVAYVAINSNLIGG
jgi:hypothetical protein